MYSTKRNSAYRNLKRPYELLHYCRAYPWLLRSACPQFKAINCSNEYFRAQFMNYYHGACELALDELNWELKNCGNSCCANFFCNFSAILQFFPKNWRSAKIAPLLDIAAIFWRFCKALFRSAWAKAIPPKFSLWLCSAIQCNFYGELLE